jgi:hypothetical protein
LTRTIIHETHTGPGLLRLRLPAGRITLTAAEDHPRTTVRLTPQRAEDPTAAEAIERTEVVRSGDSLAITVPSTGGTGMTQTVIQAGRSVVVSQNAHVVTGTMIGVAISDGVIHVGNGGTVITSGGGGGIDAEVTVPAGQRVELDTAAADVTCSGRLALLHVDTGSGDIRFTEADAAELATGSGDVHAGQVGTLHARTGSGDITVRAATGPTTLRTGSGDVRVHLSADVPLRVRTGSGDITATAAADIRIDRSGLRTGSGDITTN